jgi:hypothetical protein
MALGILGGSAIPRLLIAILLLALLQSGVSHAAPVPKAKQGALYFPTKVGTKWVYQWSYTGGSHDITLEPRHYAGHHSG